MLCGPLLEQHLAKDPSRPRGISSVIIHETADPLLLTHHGKGRGASPGQLSKVGQRTFGIRFEQRNVSDQRDPVEFSQIIARPIEDAAIQLTNDTIVFYPAGHHERKQGMSGEKIQYLGFMLAFERLNRLSELGDQRSGCVFVSKLQHLRPSVSVWGSTYDSEARGLVVEVVETNVD